jgi:hypothetical protein
VAVVIPMAFILLVADDGVIINFKRLINMILSPLHSLPRNVASDQDLEKMNICGSVRMIATARCGATADLKLVRRPFLLCRRNRPDQNVV